MLKPLLVLALLPTLAHARIGETPEQCAKRYGDLAERKGATARAVHSFAKDGVVTTCFFTDGKCVAIRFELIAPVRAGAQDTIENMPLFTDAQSAALLAANSGDSEWTTLSKEQGITTHIAKDGTRRAVTSGLHVIIQTSTDIEARKKFVMPDAVTKAIEGF
jgi:hypothetical protein